MGRFYQHTTSPVVDYSYDVPFTELWKALEYKQGRQDTALNKLSIAKDKLTNLEYIPGSSDEEYLKQKQAEYDALSEQVSGMDLSGNQAALNTAISEFADDPRLANVQRNATFYKEQQDRMQTLADSGTLDYDNIPDWIGQTDSGNAILSDRIMSAVNPNPNADAFFNGVDRDSVARNPAMLDNILNQAMDVFPDDPVVQSYVKANGGDPTNKFDRERAAKEILEAAKAKYLANIGIDASTNQPYSGSGNTALDPSKNSPFVSIVLDEALRGGQSSLPAEDLGFAEATVKKEWLESLQGVDQGSSNLYKVDISNTDLVGGKYETAQNYFKRNQQKTDQLAEKLGLWDESDPEGSRNKVEEHLISQQFYDTENFRELDNNIKESENLQRKIGSGQYSKERVAEFKRKKAKLDNIVQKTYDEADKVTMQTGVSPLEFDDKTGSYLKPAYSIDKEKYDPDGKLEADLNQLFNLTLPQGDVTVEILNNNNIIVKDGKFYVKGNYTFDEDQGDAMFTKDAGWFEKYITPSTGWNPNDWVDNLVDETGLIEQAGGGTGFTFGDGNNIYQMPMLIELSPAQVRAAQAKYDRHAIAGTAAYDDSRSQRESQMADKMAEVGQDKLLAQANRVSDGMQKVAKRVLNTQGVNDYRSGKAGYKTMTEQYLNKINLAPNERKEVEEFLKDSLDSNGRPKPGKEDELAEFYSRIEYATNSYDKAVTANPDKRPEINKEYSNFFTNEFSSISGKSLTSSTKNEMESFGIKSAGGDSYTIDNIDTFKKGVKSWASANNLLEIKSNDYPGISFDSSITSAKDIYGVKVSSPYLSSNAEKALEKISTLANKNGMNIGINSMGRPQAVQNMLIKSKDHEAAKKSAHSSGNAIDFNVKKGSNEELVIEKALRNSGVGYKTHYHDGHLHVEIT